MEEATKIISRQFQYISCYCLSIMNSLECLTLPKFQYISCYCLSYSMTLHSPRYSNFNTSHVTVYPWRSNDQDCTGRISIHLMLLFIDEFNAEAPEKNGFQYISCYCLSTPSLTWEVGCRISIHLMLLFIWSWRYRWMNT